MLNPIYPNIWGPGQLFAFSGMDGETDWSAPFVASTLDHELGFLFHLDVPRRLWCEPVSVSVDRVEPRAVTGDCVEFRIYVRGEAAFPVRYVFLDACTVVGETSTHMPPEVRAEGSAAMTRGGDVTTHSSPRAHTALVTRNFGGRLFFAFAFSPDSAVEAVKRAKHGLEVNLTGLVGRKLLFYGALPELQDAGERRRRTVAKAFSVLKTNTMSPQGLIPCRWSTPDRWPHRDMWLWDSCFHALGYRVFSADLAAETLRAVLATQHDDGFIAHRMSPTGTSNITQPPLAAWTVRKLYASSQDRAFLEDTYAQIVRFVEWVIAHRTAGQGRLLAWQTGDDPLCRCGESGMDNSPRFDSLCEPRGEARGACGGTIEAVDLNAYVVSEMRSLADIAAELGRESDASSWRSRAKTLSDLMNERLWDDASGFYFDRPEIRDSHLFPEDGEDGDGADGDCPSVRDCPHLRPHLPHLRIRTSAGFLPMFAGVPSEKQASRLRGHLLDASAFWRVFPVPSVACDEAEYSPDMWRGPTWLNIDLLIVEGLRRYGFHDVARDLVRRILEGVEHWYSRTGCLWEYYDPDGVTPPADLDRKQRLKRGAGIAPISDYNWTAACYLALAMGTF